MARVPNYKAREYVVEQKAFRGANIFARYLRNCSYCVFSYANTYPLYLRYASNWFGNAGQVSATTSRHTRLLCPADDVIWLPRAIMQMFVAYCDFRGSYANVPLDAVLRSAGLTPPPPPVLPPHYAAPVVHTHLANAVAVDWGAVRKRRVMPV